MTDIGKYLDFVIVPFIAFGVAFEVPVAVVILVMKWHSGGALIALPCMLALRLTERLQTGYE